MNLIDLNSTVAEITALSPSATQVFESVGIDYCCGGGQTLEEACRQRGLAPNLVLAKLQALREVASLTDVDVSALGLAALADHIQHVHHEYLWELIPRLNFLTVKVARVHGASDPRLVTVSEVFNTLADDMEAHMTKEENILFPMIRQLENASEAPRFHCGNIANPIRQMLSEHETADASIQRLRELTDGFTAPDWACNTYRAMLAALQAFSADMRRHVDKENNLLFPRAAKLEQEKAGAGAHNSQ